MLLNRVINGLKRPFIGSNKLNQVIFFVTSTCNLKCNTCFNWAGLNKPTDLKVDEIEKVSRNLPRFNVLLLSGGEPFLRRGLADVIRLFRKNNGISFLGIPTNGAFPEIVVAEVQKLAEIDPKLVVNIYFSIDGLENFHDDSRGIKGSFEKTLETLRQVSRLRSKYKNLTVNINTVLTSESISGIPDLIEFVKSKGPGLIDGHYFEIVRGSPQEPFLKVIPQEEVENLYESKILPYQEALYRERGGGGIPGFLLAKLAIANLACQYRIQFRNFSRGDYWPMPCTAGRSMAVIDADGKLRACELRKPIADLRAEGYDFKRFMNSIRAKNEIRKIHDEKCFCTHGCFITESMYKSRKIVFLDLPLLFLKNLFSHSLWI